jgi:membrane-bound lytic murein transglycosylase A
MAAPGDRAAFRSALEENFVPHRLATADSDTGTFTGYYEAELNGSPTRGGAFQIPLFAPPADLISVALKDFVPGAETARNLPAALVGRVEGQRLVPYDTRTSIEADAFRDRAEAIMWIDDPIAANILHIQGSGRVTMPDGGRVRVGFAAHNGHSFTGIGKILLDEGVLKPGEASMIAVRDWLRKNPDRARALMARNARYIFFRRIEGDGPIGAEGVALTPLRSMAVDPRAVPLGAPVWLETEDPDGVPLKRLMVAQDVGAAIVGAVRGDVFWGAGEPAFEKAARMKSRGRAAVMLPRPP